MIFIPKFEVKIIIKSSNDSILACTVHLPPDDNVQLITKDSYDGTQQLG